MNMMTNKIEALAVDPVILSALLVLVVLLISPARGAALEPARY